MPYRNKRMEREIQDAAYAVENALFALDRLKASPHGPPQEWVTPMESSIHKVLDTLRAALDSAANDE